jgi:hypothetical protein
LPVQNTGSERPSWFLYLVIKFYFYIFWKLFWETKPIWRC